MTQTIQYDKNPSADGAAARVSRASATPSISADAFTGWPLVGASSHKLVATATTVATVGLPNADRPAAAADQVWSVHAKIRSSQARTVQLAIVFYDTAGATLGTALRTVSATAVFTAGEVKTMQVKRAIAPAGTASVDMQVSRGAGGGAAINDAVYVDVVSLVQETTTELRRNLALDPAATSFITGTGALGWRNTRWFGSGGGAGTYSLVAGAGDGPLPEITTYARKTWTVSPSNNSGTGFDHTASGASAFPIVPGQTVTVSSYLRAISAAAKGPCQIGFEWYNAAGTLISSLNAGDVTTVLGEWMRLSLTAVAPAGAAYMRLISDIDSGTAWAPGDTLDGTGLLVESAGELDAYFDGSTLALAEVSYEWTGDVNASASRQIVATPSVPYRPPADDITAVWSGAEDASTQVYYDAEVTLIPYVDAAPCPRVEVLVTDLSPKVAAVTVHRLADDRDHEVPGAVRASTTGAITRIDYAIPPDVICTYRAEMFDVAGASGGVTAATDILMSFGTWIQNPLDPHGAVQVELLVDAEGHETTESTAVEVVYPMGRRIGVLVGGGFRGQTGHPVIVETTTLEDRAKVARMLGSYNKDVLPILLVRTPEPIDIPRPFYVGVPQRRRRNVNPLTGSTITDHDLTGDEVAPPTPALFIPLLTRADINAAYPTRAALNAANLTRLQLNRRYELAGTA